MINYPQIATVVRGLDEEAGFTGTSFESILLKFGIDPHGAMEVARQRALRMYQLDRGILGSKEPVPDKELVGGAATWLDGFVTGMKLMNSPLPDDSHRRSGI